MVGVFTPIGTAKDLHAAINGQGFVVVLFTSPSCGVTRAFDATLREIARPYAGLGQLLSVNVERFPKLSQLFGVTASPTVHVIYRSEHQGTVVGTDRNKLIRLLSRIGQRAAAPQLDMSEEEYFAATQAMHALSGSPFEDLSLADAAASTMLAGTYRSFGQLTTTSLNAEPQSPPPASSYPWPSPRSPVGSDTTSQISFPSVVPESPDGGFNNAQQYTQRGLSSTFMTAHPSLQRPAPPPPDADAALLETVRQAGATATRKAVKASVGQSPVMSKSALAGAVESAYAPTTRPASAKTGGAKSAGKLGPRLTPAAGDGWYVAGCKKCVYFRLACDLARSRQPNEQFTPVEFSTMEEYKHWLHEHATQVLKEQHIECPLVLHDGVYVGGYTDINRLLGKK